MLTHRSLLLILLMMGLVLHAGSAPEAGLPLIRNFLPREYRAEVQNWAVVQDARGVVYAANTAGVLEYDGVRWRLIPVPRGGVVRSLALGPGGSIYVGAVGEFGVLAPDSQGRMAFRPLSDGLKVCPDFTDVWSALATPRGVLFQSREALFLVEGDHVREWKASTTYHTAFAVGGRIFVREREVGLLELRGDGLALVEGGTQFKKEGVFAMASLDGPGGPGGILVGSRNLGLFRMDAAGIAPFPTHADAFLKASALYGGTRLSDGTLALATLRGGVLLLSPAGLPLGILDHAAGLQGDNVKQVSQGQGPSLWLALETGLAQVEWPAPFSAFDESLGVRGQIWDLARHQGSLYAATSQGVLVLDQAQGPAPHTGFRVVDGFTAASTRLLPVDGQLLIASARGVFSLRGGRISQLRGSSYNAISFLASRRTPGRVFVGLQGQFLSLRRDPRAPSGWADEGDVPGLTDDYYQIEEEPDGTLWLGTGSDHVVRLRLPADWKGGGTPGLRVDAFGPAQGLLGASLAIPARIGGQLTVGTQKGFFRLRADGAGFEPDARFATAMPPAPFWVHALKEDGAGRIWIAATRELKREEFCGYAEQDGKGGLRWIGDPFQRLGETQVQTLLPEPDGVVWFGGPGTIRRFDPGVRQGSGTLAFRALVRTVTQGADRVVLGGEGAAPPRLAFRDGALRFEFSAPPLGPGGELAFQVRLDGYDRDWSPWTAEAQKEYTSLPQGRYRFRVRARNAHGAVSSEAAWAFQVLPPRYLSWWAWLAYAGALGLGIWGYLRLRTRRLLQRTVFLQARITEAIWEVQDRERRLESQAADLERINNELVELNHHKDQLMGIVVHDLRNPLSGIILTLELACEEGDPAIIRRHALRALKSGEDMKNLITHFLDIAAIDAGRIQAEMGPLDGSGILQEAAARFLLPARAKGIVLEPIVPARPPTVLGDPRFLKQALDNLISNALKFSPEGARVVVRLETEGGLARFSVVDQGPGLTPEDRQRLFVRFARLSARPTAGEPSAGLGLSIVKHLVEAMGGRIQVESEPGRGATFTVELPLAP
jgi:signal transduction histidine kinase